MSHNISGIITSFKYTGALPHIILVGNYHFIPIKLPKIKTTYEAAISPFDEFSGSAKRIVKELSFFGKCAYVETNFFVEGVQKSAVWENGICISGPHVSIHGYHGDLREKLEAEYEKWLIEGHSINLSLSEIGVYCHEDKIDEFDSVRLGDYRKNDEILAEYERNRSRNKSH